MKTTVEKLSSNQVKIDFVVDAQAFEKGMQTAYNKLKGRISIPGFRRGHAPRQVIQMHYGPQVFYDDAFEAVFPDVYREAVRGARAGPGGPPQRGPGEPDRPGPGPHVSPPPSTCAPR